MPFASAGALYGPSTLAVWGLRPGIDIERIKPGHPEQNGRHERMHLTLKLEAAKPAAGNFLQQQARFDDFLQPRTAASGPGYESAGRALLRIAWSLRRAYRTRHPFHDRSAIVTSCGRISVNRLKINLSTVFAGQKVGIKQVDDKIWLVSFMQYDLGYFDHQACRVEPIENPFKAQVLPTSPV